MNIVINGLSARLGGGATFLANLLRYLEPAAGLTVYLLAPGNMTLPDTPHIRIVHPRWPTENSMLRLLWEVFALPVFLWKTRAAVLFSPGTLASPLVPPGCKIVAMSRNMLPFDRQLVAAVPMGWQRIRLFVLRYVLLWSFRRADSVIFISEFGKAVISKLVSVRSSRIIRHGAHDAFRNAEDSLPWPALLQPARRYILYVSDFYFYKNHMSVVAAYARLPQATRDAYKLVLAGEAGGPEAERVREFLAASGLSDDVVILGVVPHASLPALYHHAQMILFASSCENCSHTLIEALGAGRPVLCSDAVPMSEIGGEAVHYFKATDPEDLAGVIHRVLDDGAYARKLGIAAVERSKLFDVKDSIGAIWSHILTVAQGKP